MWGWAGEERGENEGGKGQAWGEDGGLPGVPTRFSLEAPERVEHASERGSEKIV